MPKKEIIEGVYDELLSKSRYREILCFEDEIEKIINEVDREEFSLYVSEYIAKKVKSYIEAINKNRIEEGLKIVKKLINTLSENSNNKVEQDYLTDKILSAILLKQGSTFKLNEIESLQPGIPLSQSSLLVNARDEYRIGNELKSEIQSADRIDLICSFIKWSGLRILREQLRERLSKGVEMRVITTVYMGASDFKAIEELKDLGAKVKVSFDTRRTRLHAKAWLFHRNTAFTTAYIGSSNLSASAQTDGLEWNVRISNSETPHLIEKFLASFNNYWNNEEFQLYNGKESQKKRLSKALSNEANENLNITLFDIKPYSYQKVILEKLQFKRDTQNRRRNLVVAATGTGKTIISAFDYKQFSKNSLEQPTLLFVAHRKEILSQSLITFRQVLREASFGELLVDKYQPTEWKHVFASIQSTHLTRLDWNPQKYDMVIIDEFHHAEAQTYTKLLSHIEPEYLLGLTATPERTDGVNVQDWFEDGAPIELRVWDAIENNLLVPFQYFGVHDNTDLTNISWRHGKYDSKELEILYTKSDHRVAHILKEVKDKIADPMKMKALGFCVSIKHAEYMSHSFNKAGIKSKHLSGKSNMHDREEVVSDLRKGQINVIFTVDLFNEGVDIPEIDTILFLRPTDSTILFTQQLGRGLRLSDDKECLTVLDFIGFSNKKFRFSNKFKALTNIHGRKLVKHASNGFPVLPSGCAIELDKVSQSIVLQNLKESIANTKLKLHRLYEEVRKPSSLKQFIKKTDILLEDLYRRDFYFTQLKRRCKLVEEQQTSEEKSFGRALIRSIHVDSIERLDWAIKFFSSKNIPNWKSLNLKEQTYLKMWAAIFGEQKEISNLQSLLTRFWGFPLI